MITEDKELLDLKQRYMSNFQSFDNKDELIEKHWVYAALNGAYDNGAKAAEQILTARHEKFCEWLDKNYSKGVEKWYGLNDIWDEDESKTFSELLEIYKQENP